MCPSLAVAGRRRGLDLRTVVGAQGLLCAVVVLSSLAAGEEAVSPPFRWTQIERHPENPILQVCPGTWESQWFIVDTVLKVDGRLWMYYDGAGPHDKKTTALGLAYSDDGDARHVRDRRRHLQYLLQRRCDPPGDLHGDWSDSCSFDSIGGGRSSGGIDAYRRAGVARMAAGREGQERGHQ